jgi:hypothetical protein
VLQHVLVEAGVYLIENLALAEPARDRRGSFGFVLLATKYLGTPIALVQLSLGGYSARGSTRSSRWRAEAAIAWTGIRRSTSAEANSSTVLQASMAPAYPLVPDLISTLRA